MAALTAPTALTAAPAAARARHGGMVTAVERAPELGEDLGAALRSCIWRHCSSVTDKSTFALREEDVVPETQTQGACESALRDLWEEIEGPAESYQRRRIKRLFF